MKKTTTFALSIITALMSGVISAQGIWTSTQANPAHTGYVNINTDPEKFHVLWTKQLYLNNQSVYDGPSLGSAIVTTDKYAYFDINFWYLVKAEHMWESGDRLLMAVDQQTGETVWTIKRDPSMDYTSLAFDNNKLLSFREIYGDYGVDVINPESGQVEFKIPLPRAPYAHDGLLADQGKIYPAFNRSYQDLLFYSLDSTTGKVDWVAPLTTSVGYVYEVPVATPDYIVFSLENGISAYDKKTGKPAFEILSSALYKNGGLTYHQPVPVYDAANNTVYSSHRFAPQGQYVVAAFDLSAKKIKWISEFNTGLGHPVVADNEIYVESGSGGAVGTSLQSMDPATGKINWKWVPEGDVLYTHAFPVVTENLIFVNGQKKIYAISRSTHQKVWEFDGTGKISIGNHVIFIEKQTYRKVKNSQYVAVNGLSVTAIGF